MRSNQFIIKTSALSNDEDEEDLMIEEEIFDVL